MQVEELSRKRKDVDFNDLIIDLNEENKKGASTKATLFLVKQLQILHRVALMQEKVNVFMMDGMKD